MSGEELDQFTFTEAEVEVQMLCDYEQYLEANSHVEAEPLPRAEIEKLKQCLEKWWFTVRTDAGQNTLGWRRHWFIEAGLT